MQEAWVRSLGWEDPLEEAEAIHSSIPIWRTPYGQRSLAGCSPWGGQESDTAEQLSTAQAFTAKQFQLAHLITLGNGYPRHLKKEMQVCCFFFSFSKPLGHRCLQSTADRRPPLKHIHTPSVSPQKTIQHKTKNNRRGRGFRTPGWRRHTSHQTPWEPGAQHPVPRTTH